MVYSTLYEILVDFTRDYDLIKQALQKIEHYDKTCLENMLQAVKNILLTNWGSQNYSQVLVFTDCGIGFGNTSIKNTIATIRQYKLNSSTTTTTTTTSSSSAAPITSSSIPSAEPSICLPFSYSSKLSFICFGCQSDTYFQYAIKLYQELLDVSGQKGLLFTPKQLEGNIIIGSSSSSDFPSSLEIVIKKEDGSHHEQIIQQQHHLTKSINEMIVGMCETNYKPFEAVLKCGGYFKLESSIIIWPPPLPYINKETEMTKLISRKLEICGFLSLSDIGSPMSVSRHLILPRIEHSIKSTNGKNENLSDYEKLESDIKVFYSKNDGNNSEDENNVSALTGGGGNNGGSGVGGGGGGGINIQDSIKESVCVLLHGALKVENMAALVLLNDDWFGFIYSYADSKKKSNLMLTVLPPGHDGIPWLGDLRYIGTIDDMLPGENSTFPVKPEKRSYSQNCVVWIKQAGLQSDIQKVLRHAKKLPEKTQNFYKELNRIRRAALSLGFVELLEGLSTLFEREIAVLPSSASPDCAIQLKHSALELRKLNNRDLKTIITAMPTKYNQLS